MKHADLIARIGGVSKVSKALNLEYRVVHNWTRGGDVPRRGIPSRYWPQVMKLALEAGLTLDDLVSVEGADADPTPDADSASPVAA